MTREQIERYGILIIKFALTLTTLAFLVGVLALPFSYRVVFASFFVALAISATLLSVALILLVWSE